MYNITTHTAHETRHLSETTIIYKIYTHIYIDTNFDMFPAIELKVLNTLLYVTNSVSEFTSVSYNMGLMVLCCAEGVVTYNCKSKTWQT